MEKMTRVTWEGRYRSVNGTTGWGNIDEVIPKKEAERIIRDENLRKAFVKKYFYDCSYCDDVMNFKFRDVKGDSSSSGDSSPDESLGWKATKAVGKGAFALGALGAKGVKSMFTESEESKAEYEEYLNKIENEKDRILDLNVDATDEKSLINTLTSLISTIETKGDSSSDIRNAGISKYKTTLEILKASFPACGMIPYFDGKPGEWKEKSKKETKRILKLMMYVIIGFFVLIILVRACL